MTALFAELRKAANHPCLLRSHYSNADLRAIASVAAAARSFGEQASERMIRDELATYSDFQIHQLCADLPPLRERALPAAALRASAKMVELTALLPALSAAGHRPLIFSQSTRMLDVLEAVLEPPPPVGLGLAYARLDGSTPVDERQNMIDAFNAPGSELFAFLLSTRAGDK